MLIDPYACMLIMSCLQKLVGSLLRCQLSVGQVSIKGRLRYRLTLDCGRLKYTCYEELVFDGEVALIGYTSY